MEHQLKKLLNRDLTPGRALVIGCGPIGVLHSLVLLQRGFQVWLMDTFQKRASLAQWCIGGQGLIFESVSQNVEEFDLVMVTASSATAIMTGELLVRDHGILYLFAGLNIADRAAMDRKSRFFYESLHRMAEGMLATTDSGKSIFYLGHSGYFEHLALNAIAMVAAHAAELDRVVTGVIPGWTSNHIESRLPGGIDWATSDSSPAIISVLEGAEFRSRHCKLLVQIDDSRVPYLAPVYHIPNESSIEETDDSVYTPSNESELSRVGDQLAAIKDLTIEEEEELLSYLSYLRWKRDRSK